MLVVTACGSTAAPEPAIDGVRVSDEVPSIDELRDLGLTDAQAECFERTVDPDSDGRFEDPDDFAAALSVCF